MRCFRILLFLIAFAFISLFTFFSESTSLSNVRLDDSEPVVSKLDFVATPNDYENSSVDSIINNITKIAVTDIASIAVAVIKSTEDQNRIIIESK